MDEEHPTTSGAISYQFRGIMIDHMTAASIQSMRINTVAFHPSICYATEVFFVLNSRALSEKWMKE
jgi:hypothetical protein